MVGLRPERYFWTGLSDVQNKGTFQWTVDEQVQFTHWNADMPGTQVLCSEWRSLSSFSRAVGPPHTFPDAAWKAIVLSITFMFLLFFDLPSLQPYRVKRRKKIVK